MVSIKRFCLHVNGEIARAMLIGPGAHWLRMYLLRSSPALDRHADEILAWRQRHGRNVNGDLYVMSAQLQGEPLYAYLAQARPLRLPMPEVQIFGGGAHAGRRVDIQDFMIVPSARRASTRHW